MTTEEKVDYKKNATFTKVKVNKPVTTEEKVDYKKNASQFFLDQIIKKKELL